jgi:hypothetical protein
MIENAAYPSFAQMRARAPRKRFAESGNAIDKYPGRAETMLSNTSHLRGLGVRATDGEIGTVDDFYFDDQAWAIRYLTVETGGWLGGRRVLISPISIVHTDGQAMQLDVTLTKKQVQDSPDIDTHQPVSRQHEAEFLGYYGYPYYWAGPLTGMASYPSDLAIPIMASKEALADRIGTESTDLHLRSTEAVTGYHIEAADGEMGHVVGFVVDDEAWVVRYLEVATQNWWPGKKVLISPAWIQRVSWTDSKVYASLSREAITKAPEFVESTPITREYEERLYLHYGQQPYWLHQEKHESPLSLSSV